MSIRKLIDISVITASLIFALWFALNRLIARDEGFYTYAIQLILDGQLPYRDFFYPQMPLLPFIYVLPSIVLGADWQVVRIFSGIIFALIILCTYNIVLSAAGRAWGIFAVVLIATCHLSFSWFPVVQTYGLSVLFLLLALKFIVQEKQNFFSGFLVGVFLSLSIAVRLFFAPLMLIPLLVFFNQERIGFFKGYFLGAVIVMLPVIAFFLIFPDQFWFNNLGYHLQRSTASNTESLLHKWRIFEVLFSLGRPSVKFSSFQTPFLFASLFIVFIGLLFFKFSNTTLYSTLFGVVIFIVSFLPNPTYVQYFCAVVPFAVITMALALSALSRVKYLRLVVLAFTLLITFIYLYKLSEDINRYTRTGQGVIGIGDQRGADEWNLKRLKDLKAIIKANSKPEDKIAAFWPGYLVGSSRKILPGMENHFGLLAADKLSLSEQEKYKIVDLPNIISAIKAKSPRLLVGHRRIFPTKARNAAIDAGYEKINDSGMVEIWKLPE